eukprot:Hpha_TRINITY_DN35179_c0_g1::TRINITY_DN35179_c0_g1_i1::g.168425::m.168425/K19307/BMT5; 25S rRNA (uracil2634-N3)-methyltransferase
MVKRRLVVVVASPKKSEGRKAPVVDEGEGILVVGDGDLAFSAALCEKKGGGVTATVLPSEAEHRKLYESITDKNASRIRKSGGQCIFGVDATNIGSDPRFKGRYFREAMFNFPHLGYSLQAERGGDWSRKIEHLEFFEKVFESFGAVQRAGGLAHLTVTSSPPYKLKDVKQALAARNYAFVGESPFNVEDYPGYHPVWGDARDRTKAGTSEYGKKGRRWTFAHTKCDCGMRTTSVRALEEHQAGTAHIRRMQQIVRKLKSGTAVLQSVPERPKGGKKNIKRKGKGKESGEKRPASDTNAPAAKRRRA